MSGPALIHVVVSGLATGCIYALVALSLVIVYNATRTVNFAQGELLMISAFVAWTAQRAGLPLAAALVSGVVAGGLLALLLERAIIRRAVSATHWDVLIITLGLSLALRAAAGIVWTNEELPFPALFSNRPIAIGPVRVAPVSLGVIGASLILMLALVALFRATRFGRAMRAVAQNQTAARLMGISVERVYAGSWVLAAVAGGVAAGGLLAFLVERAIIRRAVSATHWDVLIITLGLSLALRAAAGIVWTNEELPFPALFSNRPVAIGPVRVAPVSLGVIGASLVLMLALVALFRATRFGRAMRAVAQNQTAARLMGISVERVYSGAWVLAAVVGGVAGVLIAPVTFLSTKMGLIAINGFTAAVLGGFGSLPGAVAGGMLLGVIENMAPLYLPTGIRYSVPFLVMIAILVARPRGLFGSLERRKV